MGMGLQVFSPSGVKTFDSEEAQGGVCLGFFVIPEGGGIRGFPDFTSGTGYALSAGRSGGFSGYTVDNSLGYLRFNFPAYASGQTMVLFAK